MAEDVRKYGAMGNGITDDSAAFKRADAVALTQGAPVSVPHGGYLLAQNLTLQSPFLLESGALLRPAASTTLRLNGALSAPVSQVFGGSGAVVLSKFTTPIAWADWFPGGDIGVKINAAVKALARGPATIKVSPNSHAFATTIDLTDTHGIRLTSDTGNLNSVTDWGPALIWKGGAGSGSALKAPGSIGFELDHINLSYDNVRYDGSLINLSHVGGAMNTSTTHIHHARLAGTPMADRAARLIELNTTLAFTIEQTTLDHAVVGIGCTGTSNNSISIGDGVWFDKHFSDCCVRAWGGSWHIGRIVSESDPTDKAPLTTFLKLAGEVNGLTLSGCLLVDGSNGGGVLIDLAGNHVCSGISITGVNASARSGTFLRCSDVAGNTSGLQVFGNRIAGMSVGVHLGRARDASVRANKLRCTTAWMGTAPSRHDVGNNDDGT